MAKDWSDFGTIEPAKSGADEWSKFGDIEAAEKPKEQGDKRSFFRTAADLGTSFAQGAVDVNRAVAAVGGADNPIAEGLGAVGEGLNKHARSDYARARREEHARLAEKAADEGMGAEAWQAVKNFADAPGDYAAQGVGSVAGLYPALKTAGLSAARMGLGPIAAKALQFVGVGAPVGVGATKLSQHEEVYNYLREQGVPEDVARAKAAEAQSYGADNALQHGIGATLGGIDVLTGGEAVMMGGKKRLLDTIRSRGVNALRRGSEEFGTEALQGGHEKFAGNLAAIDAGDAGRDPKRGVVGAGVQEGLMGFSTGATMGAFERGKQADDVAPPAEQPALAAADALGVPGETQPPAAQPTEAEKALYAPKSLTALDRVAEIDAQLQATDPNDITTLDALLAQRETLEEAVPAAPHQSSIPDGLSERNAELMALIEEEQADLDRRVAELPRLSDGTVKVEGGTPISSIPSHQIAQRLTAAETPETRHVIATEMQRRGLEVPVLPPLTGEAGKAVAILQKQVEVADPFTEQHADLSARLTNTVAVDAQAAIDGGEMPAYRAKNGLVVTVSPSAQNPGKLQVTRYDEGKGVIGDSQYNSVEDAIRQEGISNYERMPAGEVDAVLSNAAKAEVEYQKLRAEVDAPAGRQPEVGADGRIFGMRPEQLGAKQKGGMRDDGTWYDPAAKAKRDAEEADDRRKLVEAQRAENKQRVDNAAQDVRIKALLDAGLPDAQVLQAAKELRDGDDSLVKDLARIKGIVLPEVGADSTTQPAEPPAINVRTTPRKRPASDSLIQAIINRGGINRSIMSDVGGDKGGRYQPGLFTNTGTTDLSELAQLLFEEDGFHQIDQNSDIGPARELEELIGQALGGERILNTDAMEREYQAELKERHKQEVIRLADEYGVKRTNNPRNIETLDRRVSEAIIAEISNSGDIASKTRGEALEAGMTEDEVSAIEGAIAEEPAFSGANIERDAMVKMWRKITKTLKERINERKRGTAQDARAPANQIPGENEAGNEAGREDARAEEPAADPEAGAAAERPALDLAGQTNEDIARQEQARKEAEEERQAEERRAAAAERQARIDAEVAARQSIAADNFSLDAQVNDRDAQRRADARRADDQLAGQGDIFGQAPAVQAKPEKVGADETPFIRKGDRFTDGQGKTWEVWSARSSLIEAFPVIDGKMRINNQDGQRWATDERARLANPEARTDFTPIQKEKRVVTPQIMTAAQFNSVIQIAADSVAKLRKDDVERVVSETPAPWRLDMAGRIKSARPDLAQEVDDAMSEVSLKVGAGETANTEMDVLKAEMGQAIDELASLLGAKANLTPEEETKLIPIVSKMFRIAAKMGYIKFKEAARHVLEQIRALAGNEIADKLSIDNLQAGYINIAKEIGGDKREAMAYDSIEEITQGDGNEPDQRSSTNLERDSRDAEAADELGAQGVRAGRDGDGRPGERGIPGAEGESRAGSGDGLSGREAPAAGERGNQQIYTGAPDVPAGSAGSRVDSGSDSAGLNGAPIEPNSTAFVEELAESGLSLAQAKREQANADSKEHQPGLQNIRDTLPILTEGQQEDVFKAETRFAVPDGYGMLFTNGTGTGKTFTGLGVIKRHVTAGKENIIVVVPNDKIAEDWQKSGTLLGLDISRLKDTNDAGRGVVITTYANFGQNPSLASRNWDLIVHDEAHYLAMDKDGTSTLALSALKAISLHPDGAMARAKMLYADQYAEMNRLAADAKMDRMSDDERNWSRATATQAKADVIAKDLREKEKAVKEFIAANQGEKRPRALFLSATPFAYEKSVDWANGYLFDYNEGRASEEGEFRGYNTGSNREQFFMQHFGYRMRYGKLTAPDAKVDSGLMQRQFNTWLKKKGSLSGRMLDVKADYDRRFILTESAIGARIDEALQWFEQQRNATEDANRKSALFDVAQLLSEKFDYLSRRYLLEAIKAREVIPHVKEHLALGRKVVVFHDYKKGGGFNPFDLATVSKGDEAAASGDADAMNAIIDEFRDTFKDLIESNVFRASSPITAFQKAFPGVLLFNGNVSAKDRRANVAKFQDDASGPQVMLVQSAAGKEGISLHDTTGKHQRVLFNLGQPTQPTTAIQQEGRIYRTGQVTDAIFRYLNTGTNWEKWAFATTIANRASAAENLGMGEQARALKDAFISGFEESDDYRAGMEGEGKGGKERDRAANAALTEYDRARAFYFGTQKKTSKTKAQEGADYFATPEPIGLKMVEFADIRPGEDVLEPSAGHGAIARWIPDTAEKTAIEPSMTLRPRLAMVFDGKIVDTTFEDHHVSNKYDAIVLNPPFGSGGATAIQHLAKAATHLRDGGRIVALIPRGPAADKKFDKWFYEEEERSLKPLAEHPKLGPIYKGDTVQTNASWMLNGKVVRVEPGVNGALWIQAPGSNSSSMVSAAALVKIVENGPRTKKHRPAEGLHLVADIVMPNVTFERAGTQVATRIVVIEKSKDSPQQYSPSFTDVDDINTLFDHMEGLTLRARAKPIEEVKDTDTPKTARAKTEVARAAAIANEEKAKEAGAIVDDPAQATFALNAAGNKIITNAPTIKYTTKGGKELTGVLVADKAMAKAVDKFSWATRDWGGKFFVRIEHIERPVASEPKMSRGTGSGMALRDLQAVADRLAPHFKNMPRVHVLESPSGLSTKDPSQKALRDFIRKSDAWTDVEGATHDGEIYLFASGMADEARAEHVFATHEVTHYGLRGAVGKELDAGLQHIWLHNAKVRKAAAAVKKARGLKSNVEAIEEVLADMPSAELAKLTGWRAVVKRVRNWLKKIGAVKLAAKLDAWINAGLSEQQQADLFVAEMVTAAREWVRTGKGKVDMSGTRLADPTLADDMARQEKWLAKEAKARGYQSIDELAEKAYPVFENLAALWRKKNPVEVAMLSRSGYAFDDGILDYATADQVIDGARLKELRRSAARLEKPRTGTFLQVTEDGRAIATGEKGTRIPETFIRFAQQNGLRFEARRIVPQYGNIPPANMNIGITKKSEPMPIEYRESGALYFGEGGASVDRTGMTRFSKVGAGGTAFKPVDTESAEFKRWFGDWQDPKAFSSKYPADKTPVSSAVNDDNSPMRLYHATNNDFTAFESGRESITSTTLGDFETRRHSIFTTPDVAFAEEYLKKRDGGNVMPVFANIKSPMDLRNNKAWDYVDELHDNGFPGTRWPNMPDTQMWEMFDDETGEAFVAAANKAGYDGAIMYEVNADDKMVEVWVAFDALQLKSAISNTGEFSDTNPDIRFSRAISPAPTSAPAHPPAPGNPWQAAKAKAAAILTPERIDRAIYEFQDKMIDLKRLRDHIKDIGGVINDLNDAYMGEELYHKRVAKRTEDFLAKEVKPLLADMRFRAISIEEMETYLHARHAPEANAEMAKRNPNQAEIDAGRKLAADEVKALELQLQAAQSNGGATKSIEQALNEARGKLSEWNGAQAFRGTEAERLSLSGMSDADAAKIMAGLAPGKRVHLTALAAKVDAMNAKTLDELEKYGLMDKASLDAWRNAYQHYVPLHRDEAHPDSASHPIGQGYSTKGDASKQRTGSNAKVTHILGHIAMQREAALTRGEKNHVMRRLYLMAKQNPLKDVWSIDKIPTIETIDKKTGFVKAIPDPLHKMRPNVLMLRIAGKDVAITMNENNPEAVRMAAALKNLDVDDLHYIIPTVAKGTRWFASVNTQYNPIFGIVNFTRDIQAAMLQLSTTEIAGRQGEVFKATMAIMKQVLKSGGRMPKAGQWGALFDEMQNVGGTTGYRDLFLNAEDRANSLLKELKSLERGKVSQAAHAVVEWLSDYNEALENAVRLAAYKAAIDNGMTKERAASLAKNLTVNFNRKGRQTREIGALYAFFNAAVQGTTRMAQTLAGPAGKKIMAGGVAVGALSALMGMAMMGDGDDDEYAKIPEFIKKRALIFPVSKDSYIAIPMPLGFHFLPNIGRLAVEMFAYKDKTIGKQVVSMFSVMAEAFNPLGGSAPALQMAMPTVLDPFVALAENKDWTGKAIYLENYNNLDPEPGHRRTKDSATAWSKAFSEAINAITGGTQYTPGAWSPTPDQIDYVIGQLTGGLGREIGKLATSVQAPFTGDELPPHKLPLVGRFYGNTSGPSGQSEKFYENIKLANQHENEIVGRLKDGKPTDDYLKENPSARELAARGNVAEAQVRKLRSFRKEIARRDEPDAKNRKEEINHRIAAIMKGLNHEAERLR